MTDKQTWYVRRDNDIKGPFPAGLIRRRILLGRIRETDEMSADGEDWALLKDLPELIPDVLKGDMSDPKVRERLAAAQRWADERDRDRRAGEAPPSQEIINQRTGEDRREPENVAVTGHRETRVKRAAEPETHGRGKLTFFLVAGLAVIAIFAMIKISEPPQAPASRECSAPAGPGVNWTNCQLDGAQLDGADLTGATLYSARLSGSSLREARLTGGNLAFVGFGVSDLSGADLRAVTLVGADLRQANLSGARLEGADLSYADLTGAQLSGANLHNVKLDNSIWVDGSTCMPGSRGVCQVAAVEKK